VSKMKLKLSHLKQMVREVVKESLHASNSEDLSEKQDLNKDGEHDFEDVMIARMKASGMEDEEAVKKGEKAAHKAVKSESRQRRFNRLFEAHSRITEEEMEAWKNGDWGFVSKSVDADSIYGAYEALKSKSPGQVVTLSALALELGVTPKDLENQMGGTGLRILREPYIEENI